MPPDPAPADLLDLLPVSVARFGPDLRLTSINARLCRVLGVDRVAAVGRTAAALGMAPEVWGDWAGAVRQVLATGEPGEVQYTCDLHGTRHHVYTRFAPIPGPDGKPAGVLAVALVNDEVQALRQALACSEDTLRAFLDHMPAAAWMRGDDKRYLLVNPAYCRMRGITPGQQVGHTPAEVFPPDIAAEYLANDPPPGQTARVEERVPDADGTVRVWHNVKFHVPGPDGTPRLAGIGLDLTAERQADDARRALDAEVLQAQKAEALAVLAGGVAHDFNNILTAVMGFAGLGRELVRPGPAADCFAQIEAAAERAAAQCRLMLAYAGHGRAADKPVDLGAVAREAARLLAGDTLRGVTVAVEFPPDLPPAAGDPAQLRQVVLHLLTNAAEATAGRPERAVTVRGDRPPGPGPTVRLRVTDTGAGMDPATAARVFEPFFTTKFTGRGLGLAAVAGIVRGHAGTVRVDTAPDRGSTFEVVLPAAESKVPSAEC